MEYCFTKEDHFQLAGSGGGAFVGPGFYYFDEDKDRWRYYYGSQSERQAAMAQHLRDRYSGHTFEIRMLFKDDSSGYAVFSGKAAADLAAHDLFYCLTIRRDVRELKLRSANETKPLYAWRDGEVLP